MRSKMNECFEKYVNNKLGSVDCRKDWKKIDQFGRSKMKVRTKYTTKGVRGMGWKTVKQHRVKMHRKREIQFESVTLADIERSL